ncbi:DUF6446 family protein [Pseudophaeobacter sp.]|uniref:DUF6446 family protein n=1 Tax=Pseudophaeobacter sp. TaxID=1971739 RepID=UPI00329A5D4E
MLGKFLAIVLIASGLAAGAGMYYLQVYGYYEDVEATPGEDVVLLPLGQDSPKPIAYENFQAIDASSAPIRYRACFTTRLRPEELAQLFQVSEQKHPRNAPPWFDCFDAEAIGAALEAGSATAFISVKNIEFGVDRIVAVTDQGNGYIWHELNACGEKAYDGTVVGETCPERP